jgi:hypothetical protein
MAGITSISTAFSSVQADSQAVDNMQDSATGGDDALAQGGFLPTLAIAMDGLLQHPLAELFKQAYESCEGLPTTGADTTEVRDVRPVDIGSALGIEAKEVSPLAREGSHAMLAPMARTDDSRQRGLFPSAVENALLQGETIALAGERLLLQMEAVQSDENTSSSQERQSSSTLLALGRQPTKPDEGETLRILGERLHTVRPSVELLDVPDTSISLLTREDDGGSPMRGEWPYAAPLSTKPLEALGTRISPLLCNSNGTPQITGDRLHTVSSPAKLLDVLDTLATPTMMHKGFGTSQISGEPLCTTPSTAGPTDASTSVNLLLVLRASGVSKDSGIVPTPEKSISRPQEISSGTAPNDPTLSRVSDRLTTATHDTVSARSANNHVAQQSIRDVFTPTLGTVSSFAILGNGERAFLYQMGKDGTNGVERHNSSVPPKEIGAIVPVQTFEARGSGNLPEPQPILEAGQTAMLFADKSATQLEEKLTRGQKQVTIAEADSGAPNLDDERVMLSAAGSEANAKNSNNSELGGTERGKQPLLQSTEIVMSRENAKAGGTTSKGRNEKAHGNFHMSSVEQEPAPTTSNAIAADSALRRSGDQTVESVPAGGHSLPGVQTSIAPVNVGTKPTGFMSLRWSLRT